MKNKSLTPQIRFKGYEDEWQYKPLVSIANIYGGLTYSPTNVREHGTFVLRSSNVKNGQVINADNVYVETEIVNVQNVEVGDIIMVVRNGSKALIGKHAPVIKTMPNTVIGAFMSGIRTSQPFFFNALFDTNSFSAEVDKNSGATINQITGGMFKQMGFMVPSDEEQAWIGNFFEKLQQSYTDIEREITRLEKMKQASLQKMFPRPGETTPEIRFDGFTEQWKKVRLSHIGEVRMCKRILKSQTSKQGEVPFYKIGTFGKSPDAYITYDLFEEYKRLYSFPKKGDVIISAAGTIGRSVVYDGQPAYFQDSNLIWLENDNKIVDNTFLATVLPMITWASSSTTISRIYNETVRQTYIIAPSSIEEQKSISRYFRNLDAIISAKRKKLEKLQNLKQSCLDKMFVNTTAQ